MMENTMKQSMLGCLMYHKEMLISSNSLTVTQPQDLRIYCAIND